MAPSLVPPVEPIKVLATAIQQQLGLPDGSVMLGLENWPIPDTPGLYVSLSYGPQIVIGNNNYDGVDDAGNYAEFQEAVMLHEVEVDVMSFDSSARTQKEAVLWALQSYEAQSLMEQYQMRIAATPGAFVAVEDLEETKQLNRYRLTIAVYAIHRNVKEMPYFDSLQPVRLVENP